MSEPYGLPLSLSLLVVPIPWLVKPAFPDLPVLCFPSVQILTFFEIMKKVILGSKLEIRME